MKRPSFQFYPADWMKAPDVSRCSPASRGIWIDLLCACHENDESGEIEGTVQQLARCCRCTPSEMVMAIIELWTTGTADVYMQTSTLSPSVPDLSPDCPSNVTIVCRRMAREYKSRNFSAEKKRRQRENQVVPQMSPPSRARISSSSSSSSTSVRENIPPNPQGGGVVQEPVFLPPAQEPACAPPSEQADQWFDKTFWPAYPPNPRKGDKTLCREYCRKNIRSEEHRANTIANLKRAARSPDWTKEAGQYINAPIVWLRRKPWLDPPDPKDLEPAADYDPRLQCNRAWKEMTPEQKALSESMGVTVI